ncbi:MAG: LamG domain-containing protein [Deltaproteobacteria bacterium]|nr:LamG domain-containing protein [Deltaproteobacteria bacterium]
MCRVQTAIYRNVLYVSQCVFLLVLMATDVGLEARETDFGAYYTRLDSGRPFEALSRTGEYADVVVRIDAKREFIFWRASSYLPHLKTSGGIDYVKEVVPRSGDGSGIMPDRVNTFSRVNILENTPARVVVHWRYEPSFSMSAFPVRPVNATHDGFVDEYYTITPDGHVKRTIRQATSCVDDWNDPLKVTTQEFTLTNKGIANITTKDPGDSGPAGPIKGNPLQGPNVVKPVAWWKFDEAQGTTTAESISGVAGTIPGNKATWKAGVSGTALHGDGYNTQVVLPYGKVPRITSEITLEGWISLAAYPWNDVPIVKKGDKKGYFLGVTGYGYPAFKLMVGENWVTLQVPEAKETDKQVIIQRGLYANNLDLFKWYHLAGTYSVSDGTMRLYINGVEVAQKAVGVGTGGDIQSTPDDVVLFKGPDAFPVDWIHGTSASPYALDGLLDEVKIYDARLTAAQIRQTYKNFHPGAAVIRRPDSPERKLPAPPSSGTFRAYYRTLRFYENYDNFWRYGSDADVVVEFDKTPNKFVFWHGTAYIPMLVNDKNQWYSNEFNETWATSGGDSCQEPMSEKKNLINHVRILEQSPARVVIHWRYPLKDTKYIFANYDPATGWGDWSDWYFAIYPDGTAYKLMRLWTKGRRNHEWHEGMVITGPGQHPETVVAPVGVLTLAAADGTQKSYDWIKGPPRRPNYRNQKIHIINFKSDWDPFTIGNFLRGDVYSGELTPYSVFPSWNHWPIGQVISAGRNATAPDRTAHSSFTHVSVPDYASTEEYQEKILIEGMTRAYTDKRVDQLITLYKSWNSAPDISQMRGLTSQGYNRSEGAFELTRSGDAMSFKVNASADKPLYNPAFVIKNWYSRTATASVKLTGASSSDIRQGVVIDTDGTYTMVVWLELTANNAITISITRN